MDRGASAGFLAELVNSTNSPCYLLDIYFDDGTIRMTDAWRNVVTGGNTYTAQGHFLNFSNLTETAELQVNALQLSLSAVDQSWISIALTKNYIDRQVVLSKAFLDYTQDVITAPVVIYQGSLDGMSVNDDPSGDCSISLAVTSQWGDFERRAGRHTNTQEQQVFFAADRFFEYCGQLNRQIRWGAA